MHSTSGSEDNFIVFFLGDYLVVYFIHVLTVNIILDSLFVNWIIAHTLKYNDLFFQH